MLSSMALLGTMTWNVIFYGIAWHRSPRCYPLWHCLAYRPEMSSFVALLGTTTWDAILSGIAWHNDLRIHPFWHCLTPQPKMLPFMVLLSTTTWDVILYGIAWHYLKHGEIKRWLTYKNKESLSFFFKVSLVTWNHVPKLSFWES